ncbi:MAG: hypothetical protein K6F61_02610 [Clostridiales bacterium]|nr:hypothetical protein [Clostridiales bacterium]
MNKARNGLILLLAILAVLTGILTVPADSAADSIPKQYQKALQYAKDNQPMEMDMGNVRLKPRQLLEIRNALPEGAVLKFSTSWAGTCLEWNSTEIDLNKATGSIAAEDLNAMMELVPTLKKVNSRKLRNVSNSKIIPLIEKYPDVEFTWLICLGPNHYVPSDATAYSTMNRNNGGYRLKTEELEPLKYAKGLKALDLGHNEISNLEWLRQFPDMEFLILAINKIDDLSIIGELKHLQYLEIFLNDIEDITPLINCQELLDLNISQTKVSDISVLYEIPSLQRLWANATKLTEEQIQEFGEKRPDVATRFVDRDSTRHGWRQHERYKHYIWCLRHYTWIPFDQPLP